LRETLIDGAVPDNPTRFAPRSALTERLSGCLRDLASRFRVRSAVPQSSIDLPRCLASVGLGPFPNDSTTADHPPPTNAWLLVHGPPGCGKTVLCISTLREHALPLVECFPGGVVWIHVGPLLSSDSGVNSSESTGQYAGLMEKQQILFLDRLERRLASLTRANTDHNTLGIPSHGMSPPSVSLDDASERLRRTLIRRQNRPFRGPSDEDTLSTSLLLIVLDDVWDVEVGQVLSSMPAAFLVTSRDQSVLARVAGQVNQTLWSEVRAPPPDFGGSQLCYRSVQYHA
uniref:NB-ARC domain-containing protein n=1 Tax=Echinostoma caproni TaxID=27848 RepID=A0A183AYV0_9TREM